MHAELLTTADAAERLNRSTQWVRTLAKSGELPSHVEELRGDKKRYWFDPQVVDAYIAEHPRPGMGTASARSTAAGQSMPPVGATDELVASMHRSEAQELDREVERLRGELERAHARFAELKAEYDDYIQMMSSFLLRRSSDVG